MSIASEVVAGILTRTLVAGLGVFRCGRTRYVDLEIPPTAMPLDKYQVLMPPSLSRHADFTIRGTTHELKQGMQLTLRLPSRTTRLIVAGWGVVMGPKRYHGCLTDTAILGTVCFHDVHRRPLNKLNMSLPYGASEEDLRFADANPIISGNPSDEVVRQMGFLARVQIPLRPTARQFWQAANVWISEVRVPMNCSSVTFNPTMGSINLVHVRAVCRCRLLEALESLQRKATPIVDTKGGYPEIERQAQAAFADEHVAKGEAAESQDRFSEAMANFARAAELHVTVAYLPGEESARGKHLRLAAENFIRAAEAANRAKEVLQTAAYYVDGLIAIEQAGESRREELIRRTIEALEAVSDVYSSPDNFNLDLLVKAWYHAGVISIESARDPKLSTKRVSYFEKAFYYYVERIIQSTLDETLPSYPQLKFAMERLQILKHEYRKLDIAQPALLSRIEAGIKAVSERLAEHHANLERRRQVCN